MSTAAKTWTTLIVTVVLLVIGLIIWGGGKSETMQEADNTAPATTTNQSTMSTQARTGLTTSASDSSNTALQQDLNSVDGQMNGLNSDLAATSTQTVQ